MSRDWIEILISVYVGGVTFVIIYLAGMDLITLWNVHPHLFQDSPSGADLEEMRFTVSEEALEIVRQTVTYAGEAASTAYVQSAVSEAQKSLDDLSESLRSASTADSRP